MQAADGDAQEDNFAGCEVWEEEAGEWRTNFPPPPRFDRYREGDPGEEDYVRDLTPEELQAIGADPESLAAEQAATRAGATSASMR